MRLCVTLRSAAVALAGVRVRADPSTVAAADEPAVIWLAAVSTMTEPLTLLIVNAASSPATPVPDRVMRCPAAKPSEAHVLPSPRMTVSPAAFRA